LIFQEINLFAFELFYILPIVMDLAAVVFFMIFLCRAIKTRQKMFHYLTLLFFLSSIGHIFLIGQYFTPVQTMAEQAFKIVQILQMLILFSLLLVLVMFEKNLLFSGMQTFVSILVKKHVQDSLTEY